MEKTLESLDRVLFRLAGTNDDKLFDILKVLLPKLLRMLPNTMNAITQKLLEIFTHIQKRIGGFKDPKLDTMELLKVYAEENATAFTKNFVLVFLELTILNDDRLVCVAGEMINLRLDLQTKSQQGTIMKLFLRVLSKIRQTLATMDDSVEGMEILRRGMSKLRKNELDIMCDFLADGMLYHRIADDVVPSGMSLSRVKRMGKEFERKTITNEQIRDIQMGILTFIDASINVPLYVKVIIWSIGASVGVHYSVAGHAKEKRQALMAQLQKDQKWEDSVDNLQDALSIIMWLILGSQNQENNALAVLNVDRSAVENSSQVLLLEFMTSSTKAWMCFPLVLRVLIQTVIQTVVPFDLKVKKQGLLFLQTVFEQAEGSNLAAIGNAMIESLMECRDALLHDDAKGLEQSCREILYTSFGVLGRRATTILLMNNNGRDNAILVTQFLFKSLLLEKDIVALSLQEALSSICTAFSKQASTVTRRKIEEYLFSLIHKQDPRIQRAVLEWASSLCASESIRARYMCIILAGSNGPLNQGAINGIYSNLDDTTLSNASFKHLVQLITSGPVKIEDYSIVSLTHAIELSYRCLATNNIDAESIQSCVQTFIVKIIDFALSPEYIRSTLGNEVSMLYERVSSCILGMMNLYPLIVYPIYIGRFDFILELVTKSRDYLVASNFATLLGSIVAKRYDECTEVSKMKVWETALQDVTAAMNRQGQSSVQATPGPILALGSIVQHVLLICRDLKEENHSDIFKDESFNSVMSEIQRIDGVLFDLAVKESTNLIVWRSAVQVLASWRKYASSVTSSILQNHLKIISLNVALDKLLPLMTKTAKKVNAKPAKDATKKPKYASEDSASDALILGDVVALLAYSAVNSKDTNTIVRAYESISSLMEIGNEGFQMKIGYSVYTILAKHHETPMQSSTKQSLPNESISSFILSDIVTSKIKEAKPQIRGSATIWLMVLIHAFACLKTIDVDCPSMDESLFFAYAENIHEKLLVSLSERSGFVQECAAKGIQYIYQCTVKAGNDMISPSLHQNILDQVTQHTFGGAGASSNNVYKEICRIAKQVNEPRLIYYFLGAIHDDHPLWKGNEAVALRLFVPTEASNKLCTIPTFDLNLTLHCDSVQSKVNYSSPMVNDALSLAISKVRLRLLPKVYLGQFDPNERIREAFQTIWKDLLRIESKNVGNDVADVNACQVSILTSLFDSFFKSIILSADSRKVRERIAASSALLDLLSKTKASLAPHLNELWKVSLRAFDDLNESVQERSKLLVKYVGATSIRLCNPEITKDAQYRAECVGLVLSFLVDKGIVDHAVSIRSICLEYLLQLVSIIPLNMLDGYLSKLTIASVQCLSSLEQAELAYAQFHTDKLNLSQEQMESARISLAKQSPVQKMLDLCIQRLTDEANSMDSIRLKEVLTDLSQQLEHLVRRGVGLNTRNGAAHVVVSIILQLKDEAFVRVFANSGLFNAFSYQIGVESSSTVRKAYSEAAAHIARFMTEPAIRNHIRRVCGFEVGGLTFVEIGENQQNLNASPNNAVPAPCSSQAGVWPGDNALEITSAWCLWDLTRFSRENLEDHLTVVLPIAFLGKSRDASDAESATSKLWEKIWSENTSGSDKISVTKYLPEILELASLAFTHSSWKVRRQGILAVSQAIQTAGDVPPNVYAETQSILLEAFRGKYWTGKESVLDALLSVASSSSQCKGLTLASLRVLFNRLTQEIDRTKSMDCYHQKLWEVLGKLTCLVSPMTKVADEELELSNLFNDICAICEKGLKFYASTSESIDFADRIPPILLVKVLDCVACSWPDFHTWQQKLGSKETILNFNENFVRKSSMLLISKLTESPWSLRVSIFGCLRAILDKSPPNAFGEIWDDKLLQSFVDAGIGECGATCLKYWRVRHAALGLLICIDKACDQSRINKQAWLPMLKQLQSDSTPSVCQLASQLYTTITTPESM